jgi:methylmalonyl-CoA mutase cobalamin-binding subunit
MSDTHVRDDSTRLPDGSDPIAIFAARVLDVLVDRSRRTSSTLRPDLVLALAEGMVTPDSDRIEETLAAFRRACISPAAMADVYIPAAAQHLGAHWAVDRLCFAEVSIGTARLQALVRAIGTRWGGDPAHLPGRRSVLMIVPEAEQHTLGAVVATGQMRRRGLSVCLRLGPDRSETVELLRSRVFDVAMLSIGHGERLDVSRKLVDTLRTFGPRGMPILAGGAAAAGRPDLADRTGVDYVTQDLGEALALCGCAPQVSVGAPVPAMVALQG